MVSIISKYKTRTEVFDINGLTIKLVLVTDVDQLFDEFMLRTDQDEEMQDERIPYWADLWASSIALAQHIIKSGKITKDTHVLEIGCGLGLPGIVAGKLGAKVTMTDYLKAPLEFARHNWELNNKSKAKFELLDWRKAPGTFAADVVLASDVAYESRAFPFLPNAFKVLTNPRGLIIVSEPGRSYAKDFFKSLPEKGFLVKHFKYQIFHNNIENKVSVFEIQKK
jgi:predicted nicotinamide N-methyase